STIYFLILACRLNFVPLKRCARRKYQSRRSASVILLRRVFARTFAIPLSRPRFARAPSPTRGEGIFLAWRRRCQLLRGGRNDVTPLGLLRRDRIIHRRGRAVRRLVVVVDLRQPLTRLLGLALPVQHAGIEPAARKQLH